ncbi:MAG: hypothetical protein GX333_04050 [Syntrophomonadaceae bacterium]|nr:hypothetical protein [Syntrophomonadaceae bacterium]
MHTKHVLENIIQDLDKISKMMCDLASSDEFQVKRTAYLTYHDELINIKDKLSVDIGEVENYESYTGTLDRI